MTPVLGRAAILCLIRLGLAALGVAAAAGRAHANGAFPDALSIIVPADRPHEMGLATNFGLISSSDDGQTWAWECESDATACGFLYQIGAPPQDRLFVLSAGHLAFSNDGACGWSIAGGSAVSGAVVDAFPDPLDAGRVFVIVSPNGVGKQVLYTLVQSHDGGATFDDVRFTAAVGDVLTGVEVARTDPSTIYLTAAVGPTFLPELLRSVDGGAVWQTADLSGSLGASDVRLIAIDPENAARSYLRAITLTGESLVVVDDGGSTVRTPVMLDGGHLTAFARLAAGPIIAAGVVGADAAVYRSRDGGLTFAPLPGAPHLRALAERDGVLYGAADNYVDGFALGVSTDQGDTWRALMRFDQVRAIKGCVKGSCQAACMTETSLAVWSADVCQADPSIKPPPSPGCGCRIDGRLASSLGAGPSLECPLFLLALLVLRGRRGPPRQEGHTNGRVVSGARRLGRF
jgi:photosystem II stability/assembly factor-like uncharacterized protein